MLWRRAIAAGCRPVRRAVRDIGAGDGAFLREWDHIIDARGAQAGDPNAVALRAYWTVRRDAVEAGEDGCVQIHTDAVFRRGYGWIFPVHCDAQTMRFNVGTGLWASDSRPGRTIRDFYDRFVGINPVLRRWREAATRERPVGCHVGLGLGPNLVGSHTVLRIGDAANLADPLTGDGIGNALKSGRLVADAIAGSVGRAGAAARWQTLHDQAFVPEFRMALMLRRALVGTMAKNVTAGVLAAAPFLRTRVHAAFFGETSYRAMGSGH
jgi:flavin-dependent dehydrogenase